MIRTYFRITWLSLLTLGLFAGFLFASPGQAQSAANKFISPTVATVNGEVLTEPELLFTLIREDGSAMFDDLVENEIIAGQASTLGAKLEPGEVDDYLSSAYTPEKLTVLKGAFKETLLRDTISTELLAFKTVMVKIDKVVADNKIEITDDQIQQAYLKGLPMWIKPESVRFSMIEVATQQDASAARTRIVGGEAFADVARAVSTHAATKAYGGDIGGFVPKGFTNGSRAKIEDTAFSTAVNDISQPFEVDSKWYLVMPTEKTAYEEPTLEKMHDTVRAMLLDQAVQPYLEDWRNDLWKNANVDVQYPIYMDTLPSGFTPGAQGSFIAPVVAVVNGKSIPEGAFFFHLLREHGSEVVQSLIETMLLSQEAKTESDATKAANPSAESLIATVDEARTHLNEIYDAPKLAILDAGFTPDVLNSTVIRELSAIGVEGKEIDQIVKEQDIKVTDDEIMKYYLDNLQQWTRPELVRFSIIVTITQADATAARLRITGGESFEDVCKAVSINEETKAYGGDIGNYIGRGFASGENKILEDTAFSLPVGGVSQPVEVKSQDSSQWFLVKVTDKQAAYEPAFGDKRNEIYATLLQDRIAPFLMGWRRHIWESAGIKVTYPIYADNPTPSFNQNSPTPGR